MYLVLLIKYTKSSNFISGMGIIFTENVLKRRKYFWINISPKRKLFFFKTDMRDEEKLKVQRVQRLKLGMLTYCYDP